MAYTKQVEISMRETMNDFWNELQSKKLGEAVGNAAQFCYSKLKDLRENYCCRSVAFNLIRLYQATASVPECMRIDEANPNPNLSQEIRDYYIECFTEIAHNVDGCSSEKWRKRFEAVLNRNCYPGKKDEHPIRKQDIFEIAFALHLSVLDYEWLLLRSLENDGLSATRSQDLMEMFALSVPGITMIDVREMMDTYQCSIGNRTESSIAPVTNHQILAINDEFHNMLSYWKTLQPRDAISNFTEWLKGHAADLDKSSDVAYRVYRNLVKYLYQVMVTPEDAAGDCFEQLMKSIADVEEWEFDPAALHNWLSFGSGQQLEQLKAAFESEKPGTDGGKRERKGATDNDLKAYTIWLAYPAVDSSTGRLVTQPISEVLSILYHQKPVTKNDILYMAFRYVCECYGFTKDPLDKFKRFITDVDEILKECSLPNLYLPHALEYTIGLSILSGAAENPLEVYEEILDSVLDDTGAVDESNNRVQRHSGEKPALQAKIRKAIERRTKECCIPDSNLSFNEICRIISDDWTSKNFTSTEYIFTPDRIYVEALRVPGFPIQALPICLNLETPESFQVEYENTIHTCRELVEDCYTEYQCEPSSEDLRQRSTYIILKLLERRVQSLSGVHQLKSTCATKVKVSLKLEQQ